MLETQYVRIQKIHEKRLHETGIFTPYIRLVHYFWFSGLGNYSLHGIIWEYYKQRSLQIYIAGW